MGDQVTPAGMAVSALGADRHAPRDLPQREHAGPGPDESAATHPRPPHAAAPAPELPLDEPAATIPGTLFAASLLGQRVRSFDAALAALRESRRERWTPPDQSLQLKDRAV